MKPFKQIPHYKYEVDVLVKGFGIVCKTVFANSVSEAAKKAFKNLRGKYPAGTEAQVHNMRLIG